MQEPGDLGYNGFQVSLFYLAIIDADHILNANVTIALKNITKKNAVTKEKRLGEFLRMLETSEFDVKDYSILVCWLQLYPRLAIDSQKSVRHLAHQILAAYMDKYGAKEFSKYLKTAMPIWLQGLYDDKSIANTVRSDLLRCFSGDEAKVNHKVWIIFHEQIINYCHTVLIHESASSITDERSETAEEVSFKYERAVNAALLMLQQVIRLANDHEYFFNDLASSQVNEILTLDNLWEKLGSCSSKQSLNTALFRTYLMLILEIFRLDDQGNPKPFTSNLKDLKSVFKTVSKKLIKNVKLAPASDLSSLVMYSPIILPLLGSLTALTCFTESKSVKIKKTFWYYGGLKSYSRLKDILKLGPCNSDPCYYSSLRNLFAALKRSNLVPDEDFSFVDFSSTKDAKTIIQKILLPQYLKLKGFNTLAFKYYGMQCLAYVLELFSTSKSDDLNGLAQTLFVSFLDGFSVSIMRNEDPKLRNLYATDLSAFFDSRLKNEQKDLGRALLDQIGATSAPVLGETSISSDIVGVLSNFHLISSNVSKETSDWFLEQVMEKVEESYDNGTLLQGLNILLKVTTDNEGAKLMGNWAADNLPGLISEEFVDLPLKLLRKLLEQKPSLDYSQVVNDFYLKVSMDCPQFLHQLFRIINDFHLFENDAAKASIPDAYKYLVELSKSQSRLGEDDDTVFAFFEHPEIFANLLECTTSAKGQLRIVAEIVDRDMLSHLADSACIEPLIGRALDTSSEARSVIFLEHFAESGLVADLVFRKLYEIDPRHGLSSWSDLLAKNPKMLPLKHIEAELNKAMDSVDLASLSISNPLAQNINLVSSPSTTDLSSFMLVIGRLLGSLSRLWDPKDDSMNILGSICAEYVGDYNFLVVPGDDREVDEINKIHESLSPFISRMVVTDIGLIFNCQTPDNVHAVMMNEISGKGPFTARQYYFARVLVRVLSSAFDELSLAQFDGLEIVYTKLSSHPLKLATFISSASKFVGLSSKLDRIRQFVFAEILGTRSSADISGSGVMWLSLASSFLNVDNAYDILPSHKLGMLINHLSGWMDCDVAFEKLFLTVRTVLASFLAQFIHLFGDSVPDKTWELSVDLCSNNLGLAQIDYDTTALEYFSLKLFLALSRHTNKDVFENWRQSKVSIEEDILSLVIYKQDSKAQSGANQPSALVYEIFDRVLHKATLLKNVLAEKEENLYQILAQSKALGAQKLACTLLKSHIYESQQDAILEAQMRNSNLSDESNSQSSSICLSETLMYCVSGLGVHFDEALEEKNYQEVFRFLWGWILVFDHFKESTYSMKVGYITQLKQKGDIDYLLNTIFDTIPLTNQAFMNQLVTEQLEKGAKADLSKSLIQSYEVANGLREGPVSDEVYFLLAHLCYLTYRFMGSHALQWFNEIRDVQSKQQIEKFSIRFICPILISEMLEDVEKSKEKLTINDDTLAIKVNKVTNEIKSAYVIDEQIMEMVVKIPEIFPLANVSVEGPVRLGVKENQWKAWLLASQRVITLTNGSIFDCIELFNKNVNLHFSGFEECAICYSILHQDHSLPSKNCPTCLNKFHAACLYKWFKSSGSSTCPLCRSTFNFNTGKA